MLIESQPGHDFHLRLGPRFLSELVNFFRNRRCSCLDVFKIVIYCQVFSRVVLSLQSAGKDADYAVASTIHSAARIKLAARASL